MLDRRIITAFTCGLLFCFLFGYTVVKSKKKSGVYHYDASLQVLHNSYIHKLPEDITFAGEKVHFNTPSSYSRYERELKYNTRQNSSTRLLLRNVKIWLPEIEYIIRKHQLPEDFKFLAVAESNLSNVISPKQAAGFWQLTKATAEDLGLTVNDEIDERYHPLLATEAACRYFKRSYKNFGDWTSVAASYNRGIYGLKRAYKSQKVSNFYELNLNDETSRYLYKILAMKDLISNPGRYKFSLNKYKRNSYLKKIRIKSDIPNLVKFCKEINAPYLTVKKYNPWILKNSITVEEGKSYVLLVPYHQIGITEPEKIVSDSIPTTGHIDQVTMPDKKDELLDSINTINLKINTGN